MEKGAWKRPIITASVGLLGITLLVTWDLYLNPKLTEVQTIVAAKPILQNAAIEPNDLKVTTILRTNLITQAITVPDLLLGKTATEYIGSNEQIGAYMISQTGLLPNGTFDTYPILKSWIFAVPTVLRRGDHVDLYAITTTQANTLHTALSTVPGQLLLANVRVEYVLDSNGQEVIDANPAPNVSGAENRQNSTGVIAEIDVLLTKQQWHTLVQACDQNGDLLYISDLNG